MKRRRALTHVGGEARTEGDPVVAKVLARALDVPPAHKSLAAQRLGEASLITDGFGHARKLCHGSHVTHEHSAGSERPRHRGQGLPRCKHVENDAMNGCGRDMLVKVMGDVA